MSERTGKCEWCQGNGTQPDLDNKCVTCNGDGLLEDSTGLYPNTCFDCEGSGLADMDCGLCQGTGISGAAIPGVIRKGDWEKDFGTG